MLNKKNIFGGYLGCNMFIIDMNGILVDAIFWQFQGKRS
jgi:hypothetical protein